MRIQFWFLKIILCLIYKQQTPLKSAQGILGFKSNVPLVLMKVLKVL